MGRRQRLLRANNSGSAVASTPSEVAYLTANLSGGAPAFLYSVLGTVNVSSGVVDSVVDRMGAGPDLVATLTARPAWDAVNKLITGDGSNDRLSPTANHAIFDFATLKTLVTVGVFNGTSSKTIAGITESLVAARDMEQYNGATNIRAVVSTANTMDSGVAKSASRRGVITQHNGSTTATLRVLNHTATTAAVTAYASGSNRLTIFDYFPGGGQNADGPWRATLGLTYVPSANDLAVVLPYWMTTYHNATLAA